MTTIKILKKKKIRRYSLQSKLTVPYVYTVNSLAGFKIYDYVDRMRIYKQFLRSKPLVTKSQIRVKGLISEPN